MTDVNTDLHGASRPGTPLRDLELATHLSRWHAATAHHLSASECETVSLAELLDLADPEDAARWAGVTLGYTHPLGAEWLRAAVAAGYERVAEHDLVCFAGAQEALYAVLHALLLPGDHAVIVLPGYQSVETLTLGLCAVSGVALDPASDWSLDLDAVAAALRPNTRLLAISFPNNPTGKQLEPDRLAALVALCRHRGIWLLSDEVYRLTERLPARRLPPVVDAYERGVSICALSKAYGLPGLRVGWVACREPVLIGRLTTMRQYLSTCGAGPSEVLACIALKSASVLLARNLALASANLLRLEAFFGRHQALFDCFPPQGGVVCYPRYKGADGVGHFVERMARIAGVLLLPSSVFRSDLLELPRDRFRIGFGGVGFEAGLQALEHALVVEGAGVLPPEIACGSRR